MSDMDFEQLGVTEKIVVKKLYKDLEMAIKEANEMVSLLDKINEIDMESAVINPVAKTIIGTTVDFVEQLGARLAEANLAARLMLLVLTLESRSKE